MISGAASQFTQLNLSIASLLDGVSIEDTDFVGNIVFDYAQPSGTPKSKFGYLFPSDKGALISIRLQPDISDGTRREAIALIRSAIGNDAFKLSDGSYEVSGIPVVVEGLADELSGEIVLLFAAALVVMALVLVLIFGPPLRLLPLFIALGAAGVRLRPALADRRHADDGLRRGAAGGDRARRRLRDPAPGEIPRGGGGGGATAGGGGRRGGPRRARDRHRGAGDLGRLPLARPSRRSRWSASSRSPSSPASSPRSRSRSRPGSPPSR